NRPSFDANMATDGTENQHVSSFSSIRVAGVSVCSAKGQSVAPASQQVNRSCTLRSNVRSKLCEQRSPPCMPKRFAAYSMYATTFDWLTATPFGIPVLPEVNSRYAVSLPSTTGSQGSAIFDNCRAGMTRCEDRSEDRSDDRRLEPGSQPESGMTSVTGVSEHSPRRGSKASSAAAHSRPTTRVLHPDARSITSVLSRGNLGFSGT